VLAIENIFLKKELQKEGRSFHRTHPFISHFIVKLHKRIVWLFHQTHFILARRKTEMERIELSQLEICVHDLQNTKSAVRIVENLLASSINVVWPSPVFYIAVSTNDSFWLFIKELVAYSFIERITGQAVQLFLNKVMKANVASGTNTVLVSPTLTELYNSTYHETLIHKLPCVLFWR